MSMEQELRESLQPMITAELMRSWRDGVRDGMKMAHDMAKAVHDEAIRLSDAGCTVEERAGYGAQINVLSGLMASLLIASEEAR